MEHVPLVHFFGDETDYVLGSVMKARGLTIDVIEGETVTTNPGTNIVLVDLGLLEQLRDSGELTRETAKSAFELFKPDYGTWLTEFSAGG
ncbi:MAG: hypothetical protein WC527_04525 [Candidatus Margulisiibacteriota bacterium]